MVNKCIFIISQIVCIIYTLYSKVQRRLNARESEKFVDNLKDSIQDLNILREGDIAALTKEHIF